MKLLYKYCYTYKWNTLWIDEIQLKNIKLSHNCKVGKVFLRLWFLLYLYVRVYLPSIYFLIFLTVLLPFFSIVLYVGRYIIGSPTTTIDMPRYGQVFMGKYGYKWVCMGMYGYVWVYMGIYRCILVFMGICGNVWYPSIWVYRYVIISEYYYIK